MSKGALRAMEFAGLAVFLGGGIYWYSTPADVIVAPIVVMLIGGALAGIPWLIRRKQSNQSTSYLADQVRVERERGNSGQ